ELPYKLSTPSPLTETRRLWSYLMTSFTHGIHSGAMSLNAKEEVQVRSLVESLSRAEGISAVVFDGVVTQKIADIAVDKNLKYIVGMRVRLDRAPPANVKIFTPDDLRRRQR
ncbi:MAG: hypothetical protein MUO36_02885, partial [Candidatus Hadarchaeum sp.]|nr:hypothetical protein [Candidatus Hadarchaeum sp.]